LSELIVESRGDGVEAWLSRLLTAGVLASAVVSLLGGVLYLLEHSAARTGMAEFVPVEASLNHPMAIIRGAMEFRPRAVMQLGIVLLIATPVARVAFSLVLFALRRDALYVGVTVMVLACLAYGLAGFGD